MNTETTHRSCIIVLGMHRSGTSVLSNLVSILGYELGREALAPRSDNPNGFFENAAIFRLNREIFQTHGTRWDTFNFCAERLPPVDHEKCIDAAKQVIREQFGSTRRFFIKDPRLCILLPVWRAALDDLGIRIQYLLAHRDPIEVAQSLQARDRIPHLRGLMIWAHYLLRAEHYSRGEKRMTVRYDADFQDLGALLESLAGFINTELDDEHRRSADCAYQPAFKHHGRHADGTPRELPGFLHRLIGLARAGDFDRGPELDAIRYAFDQWSSSFV